MDWQLTMDSFNIHYFHFIGWKFYFYPSNSPKMRILYPTPKVRIKEFVILMAITVMIN